MATIKALDIATNCSVTLQDTAFARWTKAMLLAWINDAQREIVKYRPDAYVVHRIFKLAAGTLQAIPATDLRLIRFVRNMGADGATPGRAVRDIERDDIDRQNPNWHSDAASAAIERGIFDDEDPKVFYCYPPQPGANQGYIEIITSTPPLACTMNGVNGSNTDSLISLDDIYAIDIYNYTMAQALSMESEYANPSAGAGYRQVFTTSMTGKAQADAAANPDKAQGK